MNLIEIKENKANIIEFCNNIKHDGGYESEFNHLKHLDLGGISFWVLLNNLNNDYNSHNLPDKKQSKKVIGWLEKKI